MREMAKRFIAAVVLASLSGWSLPVSLAAALQMHAQMVARHLASQKHDHSCCPRMGTVFAASLLEATEAMPCSGEAPCCAKSGPENPLSLPASTRTSRTGTHGPAVNIVERASEGCAACADEFSSSDPFQFHSVRSTVLRI